ncbi:MAG TPA: DUF177 domain-containing protein [Saprospiraceae bacterium]|nr:DUF177 domain-containing protein [Saprospiraceae bacterium]HPQ20366.1 DUF177 domain-containing protein [Saprospiraceae bacterium]HRX27754.1 DUF177 domain-containing protein [Saprospiraceae bacterium]
MDIQEHFTIPIKGIHNGEHEYDFVVDDAFFDVFENDIVLGGNIEVKLNLFRQFDQLELSFLLHGYVNTTCDRCLASIKLPIENDFELYIKLVGEDFETLESNNDEVMFVNKEESRLDLSQLIYEYVLLSVPLIKSYDCNEEKNPPCDFEVLNKLNVENEQNNSGNAMWDKLKDLDFTDN